MSSQQYINFACNNIIASAAYAGVFALAAEAISTVSTAHAYPGDFAVLGAVSSLVYQVTKPVFKDIFEGKGSSDSSKQVGFVANLAVSVVAAAKITSLLGFSPEIEYFCDIDFSRQAKDFVRAVGPFSLLPVGIFSGIVYGLTDIARTATDSSSEKRVWGF